MKKNKYNVSLIFFLLITLLIGCASTGIDMKEEKTKKTENENPNENTEKIDNIRISEFILGVGDTIDISVYRIDDLKKTVKIDSSGKIMFPLIGDVQADGTSIFKLRDDLKEKLSKYLIDPQITISVSEVQSQKVMVLGEVNSPGIFALDSKISAMDAISRAGGMTHDAKINNVLLIRRKQDKQVVTSLNLKKTFKEGDISQNWTLQNGDIIYVPAVTIADVSRFFSRISQIIGPFVNLESGIVLWPSAKDVLTGKDTGGSAPLTIPAK